MKAHILQHVPFEDIGSIASWLRLRDSRISYTRLFENQYFPSLENVGLMVVLGGPMSANDESVFPWLQREKVFIRDAIQRGIPMIGICLGAQLIANALGAPVYPNVHKEIGWFQVLAASCGKDVFQFPQKLLAFHWHGETFDLPAGAIRLAKSEGCENQAFQICRHVLGLQFHLETTPESIKGLVENCRSELVPGPFIQTEQQLLQAPAETYREINGIMGELLSYVTGNSC
jgi:GMP synthase-like glutamine amidotransferase